MSRLRAALLSVLGAATLAAVPTAALASTTAANPRGEISFFSGYTFPETPAGLAQCEAFGESQYVSKGVGSISCFANNPDAGQYGLWVFVQIRS
jgi:hypothetical protein